MAGALVNLHLVDGTYELFRSYFGAPSAISAGREVGGTRGLMRSMLGLIEEPEVSHVAVAFDSVIESFRNRMFDGYKTGDGIDPDLFSQFELAERAMHAMGLVVWGMVEFEADDAIAAAAKLYGDDDRVQQVVICSPDKDLCQCVRGDRVISRDRMRKKVLDEDGVLEKYGVPPASIPDWLALVGDSADGIPGIPRWGAKSAATVLRRYGHVDEIPDDEDQWDIKVRGAASLALNLRERREDARLYRKLATLREDVPLKESLDELEWQGGRKDELEALCEEVGLRNFVSQISRWRQD